MITCQRPPPGEGNILDVRDRELPAPVFRHLDGSPGRVVGRAEMIQDEPIPPAAPIVLQVSRWDPLKDPLASSRDSSAMSPTGWALTWSWPARRPPR